jgi:hypothetical protein
LFQLASGSTINERRGLPPLWPSGDEHVEWRVEDRYYLNIEDPKLNAWVVYNQFGQWSAAVFDRALEMTVFERDEKDVETAKRTIEGFISRYYGEEISSDRWMEALSPREYEIASGAVLDPACSKNLSLS